MSTTAISGTAITGQDGLYSVVTINYTNNTAAIVTAAGTGAVSGFGIAGPYGAAAGFLVGGIGAAIHTVPGPIAPPKAARPELHVTDYVCRGEPVDLVNVGSTPETKVPFIKFPIAIAKTSVDELAPSTELTAVNKPPTGSVSGTCWHVLPNITLASIKPISQVGSKAPRTDLHSGDGWLYRIVAKDSDLSKRPATADVAVGTYFSTNPRSDFPYSSCRKVTLQVTWWSDLEDAIERNAAQPDPHVLTYDVSVADPHFVSIADLKKGGAVNFKPDCGATVSGTPDSSAPAILNATVTAAESIYKAEQSWAGAGTQPPPPPH